MAIHATLKFFVCGTITHCIPMCSYCLCNVHRGYVPCFSYVSQQPKIHTVKMAFVCTFSAIHVIPEACSSFLESLSCFVVSFCSLVKRSDDAEYRDLKMASSQAGTVPDLANTFKNPVNTPAFCHFV